MWTDTCRSVSFFVNHVSEEMSENRRLFWGRSTFYMSAGLLTVRTGKAMIHRITYFVIMLFSLSALAAPVGYNKEEWLRIWYPGTLPTQFKNSFPLYFTYPSDFKVKQRGVHGKQYAFVYSPTSDLDCFINDGGEKCLGGGIFTIELSMNVGYDPRKNLFTDEGDEQAEYERKSKEHGIINIVFRRADANGVPIHERIAEVRRRKTFLAYAAIENSGEVFRVTFFQSQDQSAKDEEIWRALIDGFGTK